jgi:tripartite-type tricarboxylate transporter receptor subunit TctC
MRHFPNTQKRFSAFGAGILAALAFTTSQPAAAQSTGSGNWPTRPIRLVSPFAAGGTIDIVARLVARKLEESLGHTIIVDNRAGANGIIGTDHVAKSPADGYTMLMMTGSFSANVAAYKRLPYNPVRDFAPITQIARSYGIVLVVHPDVPARSLKELIALAQSKPGKLTYASSGVGNLTHLGGELLNLHAKTNIVHAPYKGSSQGLNDLIGRHVDMAFVSTVLALPYIKSEELRAIALTGGTRSPVIPNVPTFDEAGLKGFDLTGWYGLWFPTGTPQDRIDRVQAAMAKIVEMPDFKHKLDELGLIPVGSKSDDFRKFVDEDIKVQIDLMKQAGIQQQ